MILRLIESVSRPRLIALAVLLALFIAAPLFVGDYLLTVLILMLYFAYTGQAWNIMMGFAGQLSRQCRLRRRPAPSSAFWHFGSGWPVSISPS
jgi:hypothetical protein